jgi:hypothetical protein
MISLFLFFSLHCSKMGVSSRCDKDFTRTLGEAAKQKFDKFKHISASCCEIIDDVSVHSTPALLGDASGDSDAIVVVGKRGELAEAKRRQLEMLIQEEQEEEKRRLALSREAWFSMMRRRKEVGGEICYFVSSKFGTLFFHSFPNIPLFPPSLRSWQLNIP